MTLRKKREELPIEWLREHFEYRDGFLYRIKAYRWSDLGLAGCHTSAGYWTVSINNETYQVHRVIWAIVYGYWPKNDIDHIDHNPSNNKIENLRDVTRGVNMANAVYPNNKTGFRGVIKEKKKYVAFCHTKRLGLFNTPEEASACYLAYMKEHYDLPDQSDVR